MCTPSRVRDVVGGTLLSAASGTLKDVQSSCIDERLSADDPHGISADFAAIYEGISETISPVLPPACLGDPG